MGRGMGGKPARRHGPPSERRWQGPALLGHGFRPFFLVAGLFAPLAIAWWLVLWRGAAEAPPMGALPWHMHEMLFGYGAAAMAGFLLTAVPNWTGRLPVAGWPLAGLALLWLAGRLAMLLGQGAWAGLVDAAFLPALALLMGREIIAGRNWRNLRVLAVVALLAGANIWFHLEGGRSAELPDPALRLALGGFVLLIGLIGGRIVPSFTRNWLVQRARVKAMQNGAAKADPGALPAPFGNADRLAHGLSILALTLWVLPLATPGAAAATGALLGAAGLAHLWRLSRWRGRAVAGNPLLLVLHLSYLFLPLGFLALGLAVWAGDALWQSAALHLWGIGAIGGMTLSVMMRASAGHTGRPLMATGMMKGASLLLLLAALLRAAAALSPGESWLLDLAGLAWILAFGLFSLQIGPWLVRPRRMPGNI